MNWLLAVAATVLALIGVFFAVGPASVWQRLAGNPDMGAQTLATLTRTGKPNDALLGPAGHTPMPPDGPTATFAMPATQLFETLTTRVAAAENVPWMQLDPVALYARNVTTSPTMKFPDTNHIWVLPVGDDAATLVLYSAAQLGQSDSGKNRQRMERWLGLLADQTRADPLPQINDQ